MITKEEAAASLNGSEYRNEGSRELFAQMKAAGLVAVFGASDDLAEMRGAIEDEVGASPFKVTPRGLLQSECEEGEECPYFRKMANTAAEIRPLFDEEGYAFVYKTDIPHATFEVTDTGEPYCRGIVFALADVPA